MDRTRTRELRLLARTPGVGEVSLLEKPRNGADALLTKSGFHGNSFAAFRAAAGDDRASALGFHTRSKTVRLRTMTTVRLECALGHERSRAPILTKLPDLKLLKGKYK
jgi:hypothetical protein